MRVLISETLGEQQEEWLAQKHEVVRHSFDEEGFDDELAQADALIVRSYTLVSHALLDRAPKLQVIGRAGVGLDNIDLKACEERGIPVVHTPDANTQAVVEYVWALIYDHYRPRYTFSEPMEAATFHEWRKTEVGIQVDTLKLGIWGMGRIGRRMAAVAKAFGVEVMGYDLLSPEELGLDESTCEWVGLETLLKESDILTIHVDGRDENMNMVDAEILGEMKSGALLINAARGMLVEPYDLAAWLEQHHHAMAILDVHMPEPPDENYPLYGLPNARLLPHLASRTFDAMANMSWVVKDIDRVLSGEPPQFPAF